MKRIAIMFSVLAALGFGCADVDTERTDTAETNAAEQAELSPEELGELSAEISRDPENADEILAEHGLTEEEFEAQIRDTAANPEASGGYAQSFRGDETGS